MDDLLNVAIAILNNLAPLIEAEILPRNNKELMGLLKYNDCEEGTNAWTEKIKENLT
jgi:hypothetical protein